jgi:hypothetical protein
VNYPENALHSECEDYITFNEDYLRQAMYEVCADAGATVNTVDTSDTKVKMNDGSELSLSQYLVASSPKGIDPGFCKMSHTLLKLHLNELWDLT